MTIPCLSARLQDHGRCRLATRVGIRFRGEILASALLTLAACSSSPHLIDSAPETDFAIYRSGHIGPDELEALCDAGVEEMVVLDGTAWERECRWRDRHCPGLRVRFDHRQDVRVPLSGEFLHAFDAWVTEAQAEGRRIAFRCRHGWHRAGRLAAYYQIKFQQLPVEEAIAEMQRRGRFMSHHPTLDPQVEALNDHRAGRGCGQDPSICVREAASLGAIGLPESGLFAADACPAEQ